MTKTILLTGATDGIGLETAKRLANEDDTLILHGRSSDKLAKTVATLRERIAHAKLETETADLSILSDVASLAAAIRSKHDRVDVVINNAGVFATRAPVAANGMDLRFVVNTVAPYLLSRLLLPVIPRDGRIVNVSSAAQAPVDLDALRGGKRLSDGEAYAQSKLAITMWTRALALELGADGPSVVAVNPASLLGSKMVKDAYGIAGGDLGVGADILVRAALSEAFEGKTGRYYDNDSRRFAPPHSDAMDDRKIEALVRALDGILSGYL